MWIRRASHRPAGPLAEVKPPPKATPIAVHVKERASERDRKRHGETSVAGQEVGPARTDSNPCASGRRPENELPHGSPWFTKTPQKAFVYQHLLLYGHPSLPVTPHTIYLPKAMPKIALSDLTVKSLKPGMYLDIKTPGFGIRVGKNRR